MSRIAISPTTEEDRYTTATRVVCYSCPDEIIDISASPELEQVVDGIMNSLTLSRKEEVKAWELELTSCEHVLHLDQGDRDSVKANGMYALSTRQIYR